MWWLLCILGGGIEPFATTDHFAACEINHFFDEHGKHVFDQLIYRTHERIIDWRLAKNCDQLPIAGRATFFDAHHLRRITATSVYHTWTQWDPELEQRKEQPKESRRELSRPLSRQRVRELLQRANHVN